jgi:hypothetical protein
MNGNKPKYWFRAKRYGWGWGLPCAWQGWVVLILFVAALIGAAKLIDPAHKPFHFGGMVIFLSFVLLAVYRGKAEPPKWRWSGRNKEEKC